MCTNALMVKWVVVLRIMLFLMNVHMILWDGVKLFEFATCRKAHIPTHINICC